MRTLTVYTITAIIVSTVSAVSAQSRSTQNQQRQNQPQQNVQQQHPASAGGGNAVHGQYIAEHVAMCVECHSPRDESGRIIQGREFLGAALPFTTPPGWATRAPRNRGLLGYTDAQALRLLTEGAIGRHNEQLMLPMPRFRMSAQDAADVIAFLRSLQ
jgi:hypothetical protein